MLYMDEETYKVSQKENDNFDSILDESWNNNAKRDWKFVIKEGEQSK